MTDYVAPVAEAQAPPITATAAGSCTATRGEYTCPVLVINDTVTLGKLPAGHVIVDFILDSDDLDTDGSPAIVLQAGVTGDLDALIAASNVAQAGGVARMDQAAGLRLAPSDVDRDVIVTVTTAPTAGAAGVLGGTFIYRPASKLDK